MRATFPGSQHRHTKDRVESAESIQNAVAGIDETDLFASILHCLQQVQWIDVGTNYLCRGKIVGERDTLLAGRTAERED